MKDLVCFQQIRDARGSMTVVEGSIIPFPIRRVYYLHDIEQGASRAGHAHKTLEQILIPIEGSFDVYLDDGVSKKSCHLIDPNFGLYVPPMVWREITNFSSGAICLVLASAPYDESDYYRNYSTFLYEKNSKI